MTKISRRSTNTYQLVSLGCGWLSRPTAKFTPAFKFQHCTNRLPLTLAITAKRFELTNRVPKFGDSILEVLGLTFESWPYMIQVSYPKAGGERFANKRDIVFHKIPTWGIPMSPFSPAWLRQARGINVLRLETPKFGNQMATVIYVFLHAWYW